MKIISWNVNGLRAVHTKGFLGWLLKENADMICLQEIKAHKEQLPPELINLPGYSSYLNTAAKKGYSGVLTYTKHKPKSHNIKLGLQRFDKEGRLVELDFGQFSLMNLYIPHGGRLKENLNYKLKVYKRLVKKLKDHKNKKLILVGDFNIAHKEIDLARPKQNMNNIMFTLEERQQIDELINLGLHDSFRLVNQEGGNYTWLSYFKNAKEKGLGWRIDYGFVTDSLRKKIKNASIYQDIQFGSDHCPIGIEI